MKKIALGSLFIFCSVFILLIACKKTNSVTTPSSSEENSLQSTVTQNAVDQSDLESDDDAIANDAISAAELTPGFGKFSTEQNANISTFGITDSIYIDSTSLPGIIIDRLAFKLKIPRLILRYKGIKDLTTGYLKRGTVVVEIMNGKKWIDTGAIIKETYSITLTRGSKTRTYLGTRILTNVSGGNRFYGLPYTSIYTMHSYDTVTFDNGAKSICWISRKNSFNKQSLTFTTGGDSTINGNACTIGGFNRFGNNFLVQAPQDIVSTKDCGFYNPLSGMRIYVSTSTSNANNEKITLTYGVDSSGNQVSSGCAWGYKLNWLKLNGNQGTSIIQY